MNVAGIDAHATYLVVAVVIKAGELLQRPRRQIERVGAELPAVALLQTIPGIGPYRGLLVATEVLPIERFSSPEKLVGYAGLAPARRGRDSGPLAPATFRPARIDGFETPSFRVLSAI